MYIYIKQQKNGTLYEFAEICRAHIDLWEVIGDWCEVDD
jgi:hypothetical protein